MPLMRNLRFALFTTELLLHKILMTIILVVSGYNLYKNAIDCS